MYLCRKMNRMPQKSLIFLYLIACINIACTHQYQTEKTLHLSTLVTADSLFSLGQPLNDTTKLLNAIQFFEKHKLFHEKELSALYLYYVYNEDVNKRNINEIEPVLKCLKLKGGDKYIQASLCQYIKEICLHNYDYELALHYAKLFNHFAKDCHNNELYTFSQITLAQILHYCGEKNNRDEIVREISTHKMTKNHYLRYLLLLANIDLDENSVYSAKANLNCANNIDIPDSSFNYILRAFTNAKYFQLINNIDSAFIFYSKALESPYHCLLQAEAYDSIVNLSYKYPNIIIFQQLINNYQNLRDIGDNQRDEAQAYMLLKELTKQSVSEKRKRIIYTISILISTLIIIFLSIGLYIIRKRRKESMLKLDELSRIQSENKKLQICAIEERLNEQVSDIESFRKNYWKDFNKLYNYINISYYNLAFKLSENLNEKEIRCCSLILLNLSQKEMAEWLFLSPKTIGTLKRRIAKKLHTTSANLRQTLLNLSAS